MGWQCHTLALLPREVCPATGGMWHGVGCVMGSEMLKWIDKMPRFRGMWDFPMFEGIRTDQTFTGFFPKDQRIANYPLANPPNVHGFSGSSQVDLVPG